MPDTPSSTVVTERTPFVSLTADIDDQSIERLAVAKGVGNMRSPRHRHCPHRTLLRKRLSERPSRTATTRSRTETLNLELPDYVRTELKIMAVQQQASLRYVMNSS